MALAGRMHINYQYLWLEALYPVLVLELPFFLLFKRRCYKAFIFFDTDGKTK
jgi:hypothetical protein